MATDMQSPKLPSPRTDAIRGTVLLVVVVLGLSFLLRGCDFDDDGADAAMPTVTTPAVAPVKAAPATSSAPATPQRTVPDVTGLTFDVAQDQLSGWNWRPHDLSPRNREQYDDSNWTVVTTRPAPGEPVAAGSRLHLFVLKNSEAAWFAANPTMPAVPVDVPVTDLTENGQLLGGVEELLDYRKAPGEPADTSSHRPEETSKPIKELPTGNPAMEPAEEYQARTALPPAWSTGLTVSSLPEAQATVRAGRLITLTVRQEPIQTVPASPGGSSSSGSVSGSYSHSDDDVNVPGWLCPTRFC